MGNKKKMTILDFQKYKDEGRKFSFVTAYDYTTATIVDESDCEIILVGDSLGMIMLGYNTTVPVTVDDMIHHIKPVVKGAPNTFIIGDMPFGSYNVSKEQAIETAGLTPDADFSEICDGLVEVFTSSDFSYTGLTTAGEAATWSDTGEISKQPMGMVIQDGVYMPLDA